MFMAFMLRHVNYVMIHVQGFHVAPCKLREKNKLVSARLTSHVCKKPRAFMHGIRVAIILLVHV